MDLKVALSVFKQLEAKRIDGHDPEWKPPMFDVRLDAGSDRDDERTFRVRVSAGTLFAAGEVEPLRFLLDLASENDLTVEVQNAGFELR